MTCRRCVSPSHALGEAYLHLVTQDGVKVLPDRIETPYASLVFRDSPRPWWSRLWSKISGRSS